jgi:hypothetical protein
MDPTRFDDLVRGAALERGSASAPAVDSFAAGTLGRGAALKALGAALMSGLLAVRALPQDAEAKPKRRRKRKKRKAAPPRPAPSAPPATPEASAPKLLWASVDRDGRLVRGSGATSATRTSDGSYRVFFKRDVEECAHVVQIPYFSALGEAYPHRSAVDPTSVTVFTYDTSQGRIAANKDFHLMVMC